MKRLGALLGLWSLVYTQDYDGEVRLRIARRSPFGGYWAKTYLLSVKLLPGGITAGISYVEGWIEWRHNRKHLDFGGPQ